MISVDDLQKYFTLPNKKISHFDPLIMPFNFFSRKSNKLLVTIGASCPGGQYLDNRPVSCYGNILSNAISADWLNLSVPGAGNNYIGQLYLDLIDYLRIKNSYQSVVCIIVFTETGRDFNGWFDRHVDYASWLRTNIKDDTDYYNFLEFVNDFAIDKILSHNNLENFELLIGFDCVNPSSVIKLKEVMIKKTWLEVYNDFDLDDVCYILSPFVFEKLNSIFSIEWGLNRDVFKIWQIKQMIKSEIRLDLISDPQRFINWHPRELGHSIWAQYLYRQLEEKNQKLVTP